MGIAPLAGASHLYSACRCGPFEGNVAVQDRRAKDRSACLGPPEDAERHTRAADTPRRQRQWAEMANSALERGLSEESAIREADAVVRRSADPEDK
jgi:hypothetical protein